MRNKRLEIKNGPILRFDYGAKTEETAIQRSCVWRVVKNDTKTTPAPMKDTKNFQSLQRNHSYFYEALQYF